MKTNPVYVYDVRTQMERPIVILYDDEKLSEVIELLMGDDKEHAFILRSRLSAYEPSDPYRAMGSRGRGIPPRSEYPSYTKRSVPIKKYNDLRRLSEDLVRENKRLKEQSQTE